MKIQQTWTSGMIRQEHAERPDRLLPDTPIWGLAMNDTSNPHLISVLDQIASELQKLNVRLNTLENEVRNLKVEISGDQSILEDPPNKSEERGDL